MVVLTIFITWFVNSTFLSNFYIHSKIFIISEAYERASDIFKKYGRGVALSDEDTSIVEKYARDYNVDMYVFQLSDTVLTIVYPTLNNIGNREYLEIRDRFMEDILKLNSRDTINKKVIKTNKNFNIITYRDKEMNTDYIELIGMMNTSSGDDKNVVIIRSNLESIGESVKIANTFLAYVGIFTALIGSIAMFLISKKFTKPILILSGIAKKMSDLDFEVKYKVNTKDEIGELGSSINSLSDKLETTIMELKQANNELTTDIQRKTEIDEMRKEFLSNVSHELKTPISLIQGYAEGLKENINDDEESRDFYCEVIMDEANKMNHMVKKLLSLNELEFGNNQVDFERFDIVALIKSVLGATEILFKQKEAILHFDQTEPLYVWADEYLIEQVVTNYISNALNHVSGQKIIEIKLIPREDTVRIAVFNTGENIPEDELEKIWIKFYKVDKARTREYGGSGIGLSIVKAIMNSHNKECGAINRPIGVEFWFELDTKS
jgi:Signal transduction histidine kinase